VVAVVSGRHVTDTQHTQHAAYTPHITRYWSFVLQGSTQQRGSRPPQPESVWIVAPAASHQWGQRLGGGRAYCKWQA